MKRRLAKRVKHFLVARSGIVGSETACLNGLPRVSIAPGSRIELGSTVTLNSKWRSNAISNPTPVTLITSASQAIISIGTDVGISGSVISASESIVIGDRVLIGSGCLITDSDHHPVDIFPVTLRRFSNVEKGGVRPIKIGNDVFLGARSVVLKGVTIGDGTVVGAGSVVVSDLPSHTVCSGNPCRPLRALKTGTNDREEYA